MPVALVNKKLGKIELEVEVAINMVPNTLCSVPFTLDGKTQPWVVEVAAQGTLNAAKTRLGNKSKRISIFFMLEAKDVKVRGNC